MTPITVVIVDDHRVVTRSLQSYLESFPDLRVVGTAASGEELLERVASWRPQVIVQDLLLPGGIDGIETTRKVLKLQPSVRVVALTASTDEARMMAVLRAGAAGYIRKDAEPETLLAAIRAVARGRTYVDPYLARRVVSMPSIPPGSSRSCTMTSGRHASTCWSSSSPLAAVPTTRRSGNDSR